MKKLIRLLLVVVVVVVIAVLAGFYYIDTIAKHAVERGGTYALGVETSLRKADVRIFAGEFTLSGARVANPEGYKSDHFLHLGKGDVAVSLGSLREDVVRLPKLTLATIDMHLEKSDGKANYQVILDNLKKLSGDRPAEKKYIIDTVDIRRINVHVDVLGRSLDVPIDRIRLKNVGSAEGADGLPMAELVGVIVKALFEAVVQKAGDVIPADMLGDLAGGLRELTNLDKLGDIAEIGEIGQLTETLGGAGEGLKGKADELGDKVKDGLGGLLGGDKKGGEK